MSSKVVPPAFDITTTLYCKNTCWYCPQKLLKESYKSDILTLTLDNFKKMLANVPTEVQITFAGYCEPFQNRQAADMMVYAYQKGHRVSVYTTLVDFTSEDAEKIKDIKFECFRVHDIGQSKQEWPFITEWSPAQPNNRANALNFDTMPRKDYETVCNQSADFYMNEVLPNGDVIVCCSDWGLKNKLGNIFETNYNDLNRNWDKELCRYCAYSSKK